MITLDTFLVGLEGYLAETIGEDGFLMEKMWERKQDGKKALIVKLWVPDVVVDVELPKCKSLDEGHVGGWIFGGDRVWKD